MYDIRFIYQVSKFFVDRGSGAEHLTLTVNYGPKFLETCLSGIHMSSKMLSDQELSYKRYHGKIIRIHRKTIGIHSFTVNT